MENIIEIGLLLDFYGQLLTARQYEILDLHYNNDYSLAEIAEQLDISRQGVFDNIRRGKITLNGMETKLGLVKKFSEQKLKAEGILVDLNKIDRNSFSIIDRQYFDKVEEGILEIINVL